MGYFTLYVGLCTLFFMNLNAFLLNEELEEVESKVVDCRKSHVDYMLNQNGQLFLESTMSYNTKLALAGGMTCYVDGESLFPVCQGATYEAAQSSTLERFNFDRPVKSISAGLLWVCFIGMDGYVDCARNNERWSTEPKEAIQIDVNDDSMCAVSREHKITCWHLAYQMALDNAGNIDADDNRKDNIEEFFRLFTVPTEANVLQVGLGVGFGCGILTDYTIKCFGVDTRFYAENGLDDPPTGSNYVYVDCGLAYCCALRKDNYHVVCWGHSEHGVLLAPSDVSFVQLAVGKRHSCGVERGTFTVHCWGLNNRGQAPSFLSQEQFAQVSVGPEHSCGVTMDDRVVCWGGEAPRPNEAVYTDIGYGSGLLANGNVDYFGDTTDTSPEQRHSCSINDMTNLTSIVQRDDVICGLTLEGTVHCCDPFFFFDFGDAQTKYRMIGGAEDVFVQLDFVLGTCDAKNAKQSTVLCNSIFCAVSDDHEMTCWSGYEGTRYDIVDSMRLRLLSVTGSSKVSHVVVTPRVLCATALDHPLFICTHNDLQSNSTENAPANYFPYRWHSRPGSALFTSIDVFDEGTPMHYTVVLTDEFNELHVYTHQPIDEIVCGSTAVWYCPEYQSQTFHTSIWDDGFFFEVRVHEDVPPFIKHAGFVQSPGSLMALGNIFIHATHHDTVLNVDKLYMFPVEMNVIMCDRQCIKDRYQPLAHWSLQEDGSWNDGTHDGVLCDANPCPQYFVDDASVASYIPSSPPDIAAKPSGRLTGVFDEATTFAQDGPDPHYFPYSLHLEDGVNFNAYAPDDFLWNDVSDIHSKSLSFFFRLDKPLEGEQILFCEWGSHALSNAEVTYPIGFCLSVNNFLTRLKILRHDIVIGKEQDLQRVITTDIGVMTNMNPSDPTWHESWRRFVYSFDANTNKTTVAISGAQPLSIIHPPEAFPNYRQKMIGGILRRVAYVSLGSASFVLPELNFTFVTMPETTFSRTCAGRFADLQLYDMHLADLNLAGLAIWPANQSASTKAALEATNAVPMQVLVTQPTRTLDKVLIREAKYPGHDVSNLSDRAFQYTYLFGEHADFTANMQSAEVLVYGFDQIIHQHHSQFTAKFIGNDDHWDHDIHVETEDSMFDITCMGSACCAISDFAVTCKGHPFSNDGEQMLFKSKLKQVISFPAQVSEDGKTPDPIFCVLDVVGEVFCHWPECHTPSKANYPVNKKVCLPLISPDDINDIENADDCRNPGVHGARCYKYCSVAERVVGLPYKCNDGVWENELEQECMLVTAAMEGRCGIANDLIHFQYRGNCPSYGLLDGEKCTWGCAPGYVPSGPPLVCNGGTLLKADTASCILEEETPQLFWSYFSASDTTQFIGFLSHNHALFGQELNISAIAPVTSEVATFAMIDRNSKKMYVVRANGYVEHDGSSAQAGYENKEESCLWVTVDHGFSFKDDKVEIESNLHVTALVPSFANNMPVTEFPVVFGLKDGRIVGDIGAVNQALGQGLNAIELTDLEANQGWDAIIFRLGTLCAWRIATLEDDNNLRCWGYIIEDLVAHEYLSADELNTYVSPLTGLKNIDEFKSRRTIKEGIWTSLFNEASYVNARDFSFNLDQMTFVSSRFIMNHQSIQLPAHYYARYVDDIYFSYAVQYPCAIQLKGAISCFGQDKLNFGKVISAESSDSHMVLVDEKSGTDDAGCGQTSLRPPCASVAYAVADASFPSSYLFMSDIHLGDYSMSLQDGDVLDTCVKPVTNGDPHFAVDVEQGSLSVREQYRAGFFRITFRNGSPIMTFRSKARVVISDCEFYEGGYNSGGSLSIDRRAYTRIHNSIFEGNSATEDGGAITAVYSELVITDSKFSHNWASRGGDGGAIRVRGMRLILVNCSFVGNEATGRGGAIYFENSYVVAENCTFKDNKAADGGALFNIGESGEDSRYDGISEVYDHAAYMGLSESLYDALSGIGRNSSTLLDSTFTNNTATTSGGMIYAVDAPFVTFDSCTLQQNYAHKFGGAMYMQGSGCLIRDTALTTNYATTAGGALMLVNVPNVHVEGSSFVSNECGWAGGAIFTEDNANGGSERFSSARDGSFQQDHAVPETVGLVVIDTEFEDNVATWGRNRASNPNILRVTVLDSEERQNSEDDELLVVPGEYISFNLELMYDSAEDGEAPAIVNFSGENVDGDTRVAIAIRNESSAARIGVGADVLDQQRMLVDVGSSVVHLGMKVSYLAPLSTQAQYYVLQQPVSIYGECLFEQAWQPDKLECIDCTRDQVALLQSDGYKACVTCPPDSTDEDGACPCKKGFFGLPVTTEYGEMFKWEHFSEQDVVNVLATQQYPSVCVPCSIGALCDEEGITIETLEAEEGYYRSESAEAMFVACPNPNACAVNKVNGTLACSAGYTGFACAFCAGGYQQVNSDVPVCNKCTNDDSLVALTFLVIFAASIIGAALIYLTVSAAIAREESSIISKLTISTLQVNAVALSLSFDWSTFMTDFLNIQRDISGGGLGFLNFRCLFPTDGLASFYNESILYALSPLFFQLIAFVVLKIFIMFEKSKKQLTDREAANRYKQLYTVTFVVLLFLLHPSLCRRMFQFLSCRQLDASGHEYLISSMNEADPCWSGNHIFMLALIGTPMLIFEVLGIPLYGWYMLRKNVDKVRDDTSHSDFRNKYSFLYLGYDTKRWTYAYEAVMAIRKVGLMFIAVAFQSSRELQGLLSVLWLGGSLVFHVYARPFPNQRVNQAETTGLTASILTFFLGILTYADQEQNLDGTTSTISSGARDIISAIALVVNIMFIGYVMFLFVMETKDEIHRKSVRKSQLQLKQYEATIAASEEDDAEESKEEHDSEVFLRSSSVTPPSIPNAVNVHVDRRVSKQAW